MTDDSTRLKLINFNKMKLFGLCFILLATPLAGNCSKTIVKPTAIRETRNEFQESGSSTKNPVFENETALKEERGGFEIFEKFVNDLALNEVTLQGANADEGRTFGVKRLQFMLMPMMYKMGVMMTLLVVLTVISLKGLAVGVLLLVLKLSALFGKFLAHGHAPSHGWSAQPQPVHVHVHNNGGGNHHPSYNGWEPVSNFAADDEHYYYNKG